LHNTVVLHFIFLEIMVINEQRIEVIRMHQRDKSVMEISRELGISHQMVSKTLKRYDELGTFEDRRRSGRPKSARTAPIIRRIKEKIRRQPKRSKRQMARIEGIDEKSVRNIVKNDLASYSYKLQEAQHLDENKMRIRKERLVIHLLAWIDQKFSDVKARVTQAWCRDNLPEFIDVKQWPPYSPDLNPLDYSIWGILEAKVNNRRHRGIAQLKTALQEAWEEIDEEVLASVVDNWRRRLRACVQANGGYIEKWNSSLVQNSLLFLVVLMVTF
jgi:DNA-binding CsgD family transcriptional regulator